MSYDPTLPSSLQIVQQWFGGTISRSLIEGIHIQPETPQGASIVDDAQKYILPSHSLESWQRIEIYNQQYWWRLLGIMHENVPFVTRLFGYYDFNKFIAVPYLLKYPPNTWSLNPLGSRLPQWIEEEYENEDKEFVLNAAKIDVAFNDGFVAGTLPTIKIKNEEEMLRTPFTLQPHITLFDLDRDLFSFREKMVKEDPDYWLDNDFPEMNHEKTTAILFRNERNQMQWTKISPEEHFVLSQFITPNTINSACETIESLNKEMKKEIVQHIAEWFQDWAEMGWLCLVQN